MASTASVAPRHAAPATPPKPAERPEEKQAFAPAAGPAGANENEPASQAATESAIPPADPVSPERRAAIAGWVDAKSDQSGGVLGFGGTESSDKVRDALAGRSELGPLDAGEQRALADRMIARWEAGRGDGASGPARLVDALADDPDSRTLVGERLAARAAAITRETPFDPDRPDGNWENRARAQGYANNAVRAAGQADDPAAPGRLRSMTEALGPEGAGGLARTLAGGDGLTAGGVVTAGGSPLVRTLEALEGGAPSEARSSVVQNAFAATPASAYADPAMRRAMGAALAREWNPDDAGAAARDAERLTGILATDQGRRLLGAGGEDGPPLETRVNALATVRADSAVTGAVLERTDDPWTNPAIIAPSAQASARQYRDARGDAPVALAGTDLDNTVGTAMGLPPALPPGTDPAAAEAAAARGAFNFYASGDAAEPVKAVADQIRAIAGDGPANVTVLPVTYSDGTTGPVQLPLFRVTDPSGAERYVDNTGRAYDDFEDWRTNNALPPGTQVYPEGGHLAAGPDGRVALGQGNTPKTVDTFGEHVAGILDKAALVGGIVAGGVLIVGTGGLATPVVVGATAVAVGAGAWGAYRSGSELLDRGQHGQSLNPVTDAEARGLWLSLGANVASLGAFGSAARLSQLGQAGRAVAPLEASLHGYAQAGAFALDTAAVADQGIATARNWDRMSGEERATSILQMSFWGVGAGVGLRASGTRNPGDMFNPVTLRDAILAANPPPVAVDASLPGNAAKIDVDPATGVVRGVRHAPGASAEDIRLHTETAQAIQRGVTLEGQIDRLFRRTGEPGPGSVGHNARIDIGKINERLASQARALEDPALDGRTRAQIEADVDADRAYIDQLSEKVASFVRDPADATVDGPSTGLALARQQGVERLFDTLPEGLSNQYVWKVGPNGALEVAARRPELADKLPAYALRGDNDNARLEQTRPGTLQLVNGRLPRNAIHAGSLFTRDQLRAEAANGDRSVERFDQGLGQLSAEVRAQYAGGIRYSDAGFPQFPSVFRAAIGSDLYDAGRPTHFAEANRLLLADLDSGGDNQLSRAGLTGTQIDQIRASIGRDADASPKGWTWHHTENPGELILVPRGIHEAYQHTGGEALWGGGE
ncbi:DUF4781 domain-containing protein [Methylobacterium aquaticum]|uniref:DUF4781 domain-containing protein n=1 Tax=Methylobacterium aquaticum TaxID=270351 RepID=UPI003D167357